MGLKAIQYSGKVSNIQQEKVYMVLVIEFLARASPSTERVWRFCCVGRLTFSQVAFFCCFLIQTHLPRLLLLSPSFVSPLCTFSLFLQLSNYKHKSSFLSPLCLIWQPVLKLHNE